jgi:hypothetical protein
MVEILLFQGREWVNATKELFKLPANLVVDTDKWDRRLKHIHITLSAPDCRITKFDDITRLEPSPRARKGIYVVKTVWDIAMRKCETQGPLPRRRPRRASRQAAVAQPAPEAISDSGNSVVQDRASAPGQEAAVEGPSNETDDGSDINDESDTEAGAQDNSGTKTLARITLEDGECFQHDGQRHEIKVYGERTMTGLYLDAREVAASIGMHFFNMPSTIAVEEVIVGGLGTKVLPWHSFLHLTFLKAATHPVANAISEWVSNTMFAVQFEGGSGVATQAEFSSRSQRYSLATYIGHLDSTDQVIYALDAFPAEALEAAYPGTVAPLVSGGDLRGRRITKIGCGKRDRVADVRCDLNRILPGHDPRPIFVMHVPSVTDKELEEMFEKPLHAEFSDVRIGHNGYPSILGPRNSNYTEMFVVDADLKELAHRIASSMVDRHTRELRRSAEERLDSAHKQLAELSEARMENKVKETKIHHLEAALEKSEVALKKGEVALEKSEVALEKSEAVNKKGEEECTRLRDTIAQLLPRKMSALKSAFTRVVS